MIRSRRPSPQMSAVLTALFEQAPGWIHGYDLMKRTGLKSGSLYPLLMRMADRGLVMREWQPAAAPGRPPRQVYRLTAAGVELAQQAGGDAATLGLAGARA